MLGLRTQENEKHKRFFEIVQKAAAKHGGPFLYPRRRFKRKICPARHINCAFVYSFAILGYFQYAEYPHRIDF